VSALKARVWVAQGKLEEALEWTHERGLSVADDLSHLREFEHITLARVLLARQAVPDAMRLLESLLRAADGGARTASVIELLLLQAVGFQMQDNIAAALRPLDRALTLGEPQGYIRIFVDEGPAMATLLQAAAKRTTAPEYVRRLLAASGNFDNTTPVSNVLTEPLSERELDVLRLLGTDMDGPDIARQLVVSLSTVRTHTRSIYSKLGVNNRRAAVSRAHELHLLRPDRTRLNQHINHHM
jgi:LuxR family transcriptional regulator, maltose regulon positive regulatory protein